MKRRQENSCQFDDDGSHQENDSAVQGEATTSTELVTPTTTRDEFLKADSLSKLCVSIIARWMRACGFIYKKRVKRYFIDGHQKPETIAYRPVYTK